MNIKEDWIEYIEALQNRICTALETNDGKSKFIEDEWQRPEGGGGKTRVISDGKLFEKGGVNTSVVFGNVSEAMKTQLKIDGAKWFACGLSLVIHPFNPFVPTVHCNYRMFELYNEKDEVIDRWFGGGTDLTPHYLFEEDARHFHQTYKDVCDQFDPSFYPTFKKECDDYFVNHHRNGERRGIGGIFYDYQGRLNKQNDSKTEASAKVVPTGRDRDGAFWMNFGKACGNAFIPA